MSTNLIGIVVLLTKDAHRPPRDERRDVLDGVSVARPVAISGHVSQVRGQDCPRSHTQRMSPRQRFLIIDVGPRPRDRPRLVVHRDHVRDGEQAATPGTVLSHDLA